MFEILSTCIGGGYMYCRTNPVHPNANSNGLYPLHRVRMENKVKRLLTYNDVVHHVDGNKNNNLIENLELMTRRNHAKGHRPNVPHITCVCGQCGKRFALRPNFYRGRMKTSKTGKLFCSRSCGSTYQYRK